MRADLHISAGTLIAFLLVLSRMVGVFVFVPMPFKEAGPSISRVVLALGCTITLYSRWPVVNVAQLSIFSTAALIASDAVLGISIGLMVSFLSEAFTVGAQSIALQAGYGYASVVDPTNQADSDILAVLAQLMAGLFFFTTGLHRTLVRIFADSLDKFPPGSFSPNQNLAGEVLRLGSGIFLVGLRLALPIVGLLLVTEISMALVGRVNSQLHLSSHAFPVKMLLALVALSSILVVTPSLYAGYADEIFRLIRGTFSR